MTQIEDTLYEMQAMTVQNIEDIEELGGFLNGFTIVLDDGTRVGVQVESRY